LKFKNKKSGKGRAANHQNYTRTHTLSLFCSNRFGNGRGEFQIFVSKHHLRQTTTTMLQQQLTETEKEKRNTTTNHTIIHIKITATALLNRRRTVQIQDRQAKQLSSN